MAKQHSAPEFELSDPANDDANQTKGMTRAEALAEAEKAFFTAQQHAGRAMDDLQDRPGPELEIAYAVESLATGLKLLAAVERGNVGGN